MIIKVFLTIGSILLICAITSAGMIIVDEKRENMWSKITMITLILGAAISIGGGVLITIWTNSVNDLI